MAALTLASVLGVAAQFILTNPASARQYQFSTVAGQPGAWGWEDGRTNTCGFNNPNAMVVDAQGNIYVADSLNHLLRIITPAGDVRTVAGRLLSDDGTGHHEAEPGDGVGPEAHFYYPAGLAINGAGFVVVADAWHHTLRLVTPEGRVTTLAGLALHYGHADGAGVFARFDDPTGLAADAAGNIFVADQGSHTIRMVSQDGQVTTVAGGAYQPGSADGSALQARFFHPTGLAFDRAGNLYIADRRNNVIRKLTPDGQVSTVAGLAGSPGHADGQGATARFFYPGGVAVDHAGNLLVTDDMSHVIRLITPAGMVSTVGGIPWAGDWADGVAAYSRFYCSFGLTMDTDGSLLIADSGNHVIRRGTLLPNPRLGLRFEASRPRLQIEGAPDTVVVVEYRTALDDAAGWQYLDSCWLGGGTGLVTDEDAGLVPQRFYRLRPE